MTEEIKNDLFIMGKIRPNFQTGLISPEDCIRLHRVVYKNAMLHEDSQKSLQAATARRLKILRAQIGENNSILKEYNEKYRVEACISLTKEISRLEQISQEVF